MTKLKWQNLIVLNKNVSNHIVNLLQYCVILENVYILQHALLYKQSKLFSSLILGLYLKFTLVRNAHLLTLNFKQDWLTPIQ